MCVSHAMDKVRNTELTEIPGIKKLPCSSIRLERMQLKQPNSSNRHEAVLPTSAGCTSQRSSFSRASRVNPIYPSFDELKYRLTRGRPIRKVNVEAEKQEGTSQNVHVPQEEELAPLVLNSRSRASSMPVLSPNHVDATLELGQPVNPAHQIRQEGNQVQPVLQPENLQVPQLPDHGQNLANIFSFAIGLDMRPVNQQQMARGIPYQNPIHPLLVMIPGENDEHLGLGRMPLQPDLVRNRQ
uniref:Uncharacterized protein n=1 Tax=Caenorhabditis tropicalis TaxID=1561998 RepID=A0A1I7TLL9_9PELO